MRGLDQGHARSAHGGLDLWDAHLLHAGGHHLKHGGEIGIFQGGVNFYNDGRVQGEDPVKVKILLAAPYWG